MSNESNSTKSAPQVLVVDDSAMILNSVQQLFSLEGIEVIVAESGKKCLQELRNGFRGVILMDIMMPEMNGWETIRAIEQSGMLDGNIIVMLTALEAPDNSMDGLQNLVLDYIVKPFDTNDIIARVRRYLEYLK